MAARIQEQKQIKYGNRGQAFEELLNRTNEMYEAQGLAAIQKRPTPVKVMKSSGTRVLAGYYEAKSTVDYDGIYRGRALYFEAKSTKELDRFDLKNISDHQYEHLSKCYSYGAICFVLIEYRKQRRTYLLPFTALRAFVRQAASGGRKSITLDDFEIEGYEVQAARVPLDYLAVVDSLHFGDQANA